VLSDGGTDAGYASQACRRRKAKQRASLTPQSSIATRNTPTPTSAALLHHPTNCFAGRIVLFDFILFTATAATQLCIRYKGHSAKPFLLAPDTK
jgi:hypothetical protein